MLPPLLLAVLPLLSRAADLPELGHLLPPWLAGNLDELVRLAADSCAALPLDALSERAPAPDVDVLEFTKNGSATYRLSEAHLHVSDRGPWNLTVYIPGWWNTPTDESTTTLVEALLHKNPSVLVLDTRPVFCTGYVTSAAGVPGLARRLYKFVRLLHAAGRAPALTLIGYSLGAHVAGAAGRLLRTHRQHSVQRIAALDPARPCFARRSAHRLARGDARFVHVLHTSSGVLGLEQPLGDADVYANGLSAVQPECRSARVPPACDHARAWRLFAASVLDPHALRARRCADWEELVDGRCGGREAALGYACSAETRGLFLYTSPASASDPPLRVFNPLDVRTWWPSAH